MNKLILEGELEFYEIEDGYLGIAASIDGEDLDYTIGRHFNKVSYDGCQWYLEDDNPKVKRVRITIETIAE